MTGPDNSSRRAVATGDAGTARTPPAASRPTSPSSSFPAATPFSDDSPATARTDRRHEPGRPPPGPAAPTSRCPPSPRHELATSSDSVTASYDDGLPSPPDHLRRRAASDARARRTRRPVGKQTKSRAIAGLVSASSACCWSAGGLYLIGEFGFRIFDVMLNGGGQPAGWDIAWTSTGAALIFVAVLLNGWSPWATLVPGLAADRGRRLVHRLVRRRRPGRQLPSTGCSPARRWSSGASPAGCWCSA